MSRKSKATKEEIQRNRDEAYQNGWSDGYAEGFGKATEAAIAALPAVMGGAAALLKDVPRHSLDFCDRMEIDKDGVWMHEDHVLAALEPVAAPDPVHRPTMTDMMVDPDMLDAFMEANPLPPDPAAIREAALREALDALTWTDLFGRTAAEKHVALEQYCLDRDAILALIKKGAADA